MNSAFLGQLKRIGDGKAGWYRGSLTLGMAVLGPALATFLNARVSYLWCFAVIAFLFGVMALFSLSFFPEREEQAAVPAQGGFLGQVGALLRNPDVAESCAIEFASGATGSLFATFILLAAMALPGLTAADGVTVLLVDGGVTMACLFLGANLIRRLGRRPAYAAGLVLAVISLAIAGMAGGLAGLILGGILLSVASALVHLVNMIVLSRIPGEKSKASGVYQLSQMIGATTGALLGGVMSTVMPVQHVFLAWIPLLLLAAPPIWLLGRQPRAIPSPSTGVPS